VLCVDVHPNGTLVASGGADRLVKLWKYDDGTCSAIGAGHVGEVTRCSFSPDGSVLITADKHGVLMFWDIPQ
jgi:WD40 repeat protein